GWGGGGGGDADAAGGGGGGAGGGEGEVVVGGVRAGGARAAVEARLWLRLEPVAPDQKARDRASGEAREHEPHRRAQDADLDRVCDAAGLGDHRRPGDRGAVAAGHRNAPREQSDRRIEAEEAG